jgi:hypothetical protein
MAGSLMWGKDYDNNEWVPLRVDSDGSIHVVGYVDELNDIGDVDVASPSDNDILYWDDDDSKWKARALEDSDIPAGIARDAEVTAAVAAEAALRATGDSDEATARDAAIATHAADKDAHHSNVLSLTFVIDGGGSAITTGEKGHLEIPFACTITQVTMLADQAGDIVVDVWKDTYANFPPTDADSITASAPPTISSAQKSQDATLTGWTKAITAGDILAFNVDSCATITRVTISLKVTKT